MSPAFNCERLISMVEMLTGHSDIVDRTLDPQCPVVSSKGPNPIFADRTRPVMVDRTQPSVRCITLITVLTDNMTGRNPSASGQLTDASIIATNSISPLTSSPLFKCANHQVYHLVHMC